MMRVSRVAILLLLIGALTPVSNAADYTSLELSTTVYADGAVGIVYYVEADPTAVRIAVPLFGTDFSDLIVVNQDGIPLVTSESGSTVTVDALGATGLTFTYTTPQLTSKEGILWTLTLTAPTNLVIILPSGATVVSMSQIPLDVQTVDGRTRVTLPPGEDSVSYVIQTSVTLDHAQAVITNAETMINEVKSSGVDTADADAILAQAKNALSSGDYLLAEQLATEAKSSALDAALKAQAAASAIQRATAAIQQAKNEGRISTVSDAEEMLANAEAAYASGDYTGAKADADTAYNTATNSKATFNFMLLVAVGAVFAVVGVVVYVYLKRRKPVEPQQPVKKTEDAPVDLEAIFKKNPDLRVDDKEVLRFLAERGGEAFANEIRDRFEIPRTSAWRMIRRLIEAGIVEEHKVGGQSLIAVIKKYREAKEA
jgi:uncharacterized membrane protein